MYINVIKDFEAESSDVDWCEDNYVITPHVVEFWNTVSNIPMFVVPCVWLWLSREYTQRVSRDMLNVSICTIVIALSSAYFHATLSLMGQLVDEWSILWIQMVSIYQWFPTKYYPSFCKEDRTKLKRALLVSTVVCTVGGYMLPAVNMFALIIFGTTLWIPVWDIYKSATYSIEHDLKYRNLKLFCFAVTVWCLDIFTCNVWKQLNFPYLHSIWHVAIVWSFYPLLILIAHLHTKKTRPEWDVSLEFWPRWAGQQGLPYLKVKNPPKEKTKAA